MKFHRNPDGSLLIQQWVSLHLTMKGAWAHARWRDRHMPKLIDPYRIYLPEPWGPFWRVDKYWAPTSRLRY